MSNHVRKEKKERKTREKRKERKEKKEKKRKRIKEEKYENKQYIYNFKGDGGRGEGERHLERRER